jgi:hypothetical protein
VRIFLLTLCLLWQPLAGLLPAGIGERAEQFGHVIVHGQALGHHHHDDASLHLDAEEAVAHQHVLDGGQPAGLPALPVDIEAAASGSAVAAATLPMPPSAVLEGLLRPPRGRSA